MNIIDEFANNIQNSYLKYKHIARYPLAKRAVEIATLLFKENVIRGFFIEKVHGKQNLCILLKYGGQKKIFQKMRSFSSLYSISPNKVLKHKNGFGLQVVSTAKGLMTCRSALKFKIAGVKVITIY